MALTYKIEQFVKKISSPVIVMIGSDMMEFPNGESAYEHTYDKNYIITDIKSKENKVYITMVENDRVNDVSWCGEEQVSFF